MMFYMSGGPDQRKKWLNFGKDPNRTKYPEIFGIGPWWRLAFYECFLVTI